MRVGRGSSSKRRRRAARTEDGARRALRPASPRPASNVWRAGPASWPRHSGSTRPGRVTDLCDPASSLRLERDVDDAADTVDDRAVQVTPRIGVAYAGPEVGIAAVAVRDRRSPVGLGPARRPLRRRTMDARSPERCSSSRSFASGSRRRPRSSRLQRMAEVLQPSADPVDRRSDNSTRPTRHERCSASDRASVSVGRTTSLPGSTAQHAAVASSLSSSSSIADTLDAAARLATSLADERRPLLRDLGRELHALPRSAPRWRAASTPSASCSTPPRRVSAGCELPSGSPTTGSDGGWTRSSAPSSAAHSRIPIVTLRNGRYVVPVKAEARSRVKGIVHDASGSGQRRCSSSRWSPSSSGTPGARRRPPSRRRSPGSSTSCRRLIGSMPPPLRETLDALARFDLWAAKASLAADWTRHVPRRRTDPRSCSCQHATPG